jgi:hydrogenase expression/formation protein HypE
MKDSLSPDDFASCPLPISAHQTIQLSHGSGGRMMHDLVSRLFVQAFDNPALSKRDDQAVLDVGGLKLAFTTDSFVVDPIFFPGGDIGDLAVNGTVNDLVMCGAHPLYLSAGFIIEEGFSLAELEKVVASMKAASATAGVRIVTGDTKVVGKGKGDKLFVNTAGIGLIRHAYRISADNLQPGDVIILSGTIGDHGMAVMSRREGLAFESPIISDTAPLHGLVETMMKAATTPVNPDAYALHAMRDPTRGGLAATLNEWAETSKVGIRIHENRIPIKSEVAGACELLGIDPLYVANEGKLIAAVAKDSAPAVLAAMTAHALGHRATIIGEVAADRPGMVSMETRIGGWRMVDMPVGEQLPRIC